MSSPDNDLKRIVEKEKRKLERLLCITAVFLGYHYVWAFQHSLGLRLDYMGFRTLLQLPVVALVVLPLTYWVLVRADPLEHSHWKLPSVRFFQAQFPSRYITDRCERCTWTRDDCQNLVEPGSADAGMYWFNNFFKGMFLVEHPEWVSRTLDKGYTCKLIFGINALVVTFIILGALTLLFGMGTVYEVTQYEILFFLVCVAVLCFIAAMHRVDNENPGNSAGCWHAWWEINQAHITWLRQHESALVKHVCHAGQNTRQFHERTTDDAF